MESHADVEAAKKQSPLRVVEVDFVFSLNRADKPPDYAFTETVF